MNKEDIKFARKNLNLVKLEEECSCGKKYVVQVSNHHKKSIETEKKCLDCWEKNEEDKT